MRILVTGACGFVGKHLIAELNAAGHEVFGVDVGHPPAGLLPEERCVTADITSLETMSKVVFDILPEACVHLAAWAFVPAGGANPQKMIEINVMGTTQVLEAFRIVAPKARLLAVSTAQVYGMKRREAPVREEDPLFPESFYAISKAAADEIARLYGRQCGMPVMVARPHNHIGPGQSPQFAVAAFARQIRAIAKGATPVMKVGNLDNVRDFTDVRDIVRAYRLLLEKGQPGQAYNIASGRQVRVGDLLDTLCRLAGVQPRIERDAALYRPDDGSPILDTQRLVDATGWTPGVRLDKTLKDILDQP
jgi:GDP-4-dehydro-6-deoxy-D-mannose reductase